LAESIKISTNMSEPGQDQEKQTFDEEVVAQQNEAAEAAIQAPAPHSDENQSKAAEGEPEVLEAKKEDSVVEEPAAKEASP
jgi:hypothetical protein